VGEAGGTRVRWREDHPQQEIYLVAAPFTLYRQATPDAEAEVFLRTPDEALAKRYLNATGKYLALYSNLIGTYPYAKFALVENFWPTGYGMPSFTLLGPQVIRLPLFPSRSRWSSISPAARHWNGRFRCSPGRQKSTYGCPQRPFGSMPIRASTCFVVWWPESRPRR
jgi:hypothetical protein